MIVSSQARGRNDVVPSRGSGTILSHLPIPAGGGPRVDLTLAAHQQFVLSPKLFCCSAKVASVGKGVTLARLEGVPLVRGWGKYLWKLYGKKIK